MDESRGARAHPVALVAALLLMAFSTGLAGSALADPGQGGRAASSQRASASTQARDSGSGGSDHSQGNAGTTGSYDSPQPPSKADQNSGGANGQCPGGPYCSTRDGSPSLNGSPQGTAKGRPCAGCVGKADNKNPKGQNPNGSDNNAGYECDRNQGIGQTNPAHTGCTTSPPPCVDGDCTPPCADGDCTPPCAHGDCTPPCAHGDCRPPSCEGCDESSHDETNGRARAAVVLGVEATASHHAAAAAPTAARAGVLPSTGAPSALELAGLAGLGLVLAGATTLVLVRRRPGAR